MYSFRKNKPSKKYNNQYYVNSKVNSKNLSLQEKEYFTFDDERERKYFIATCEERKDYPY